MPTRVKSPPYASYDYEVDYSDLPDRESIDTQAIHDIREYLGDERFNLLLDVAEQINTKEATIDQLNTTMAFIGITGRPFHAFARRYCLTQYREWMHGGGDAVLTDEHGYAIE